MGTCREIGPADDDHDHEQIQELVADIRTRIQRGGKEDEFRNACDQARRYVVVGCCDSINTDRNETSAAAAEWSAVGWGTLAVLSAKRPVWSKCFEAPAYSNDCNGQGKAYWRRVWGDTRRRSFRDSTSRRRRRR
jgi:hypothetical protein